MSIKRGIAYGGGAIIGIGVAVFLWIWFAPCALGGCAPLDRLAEFQVEGSELLDVNGDPFARLATVNRQIVPLTDLPPHVPQAFVAIEDQRFYDHHGVDFFRTVGALLENVRSGEVSEGGSTITQQLARNLFPEWLPYTQRNIQRKVMEARVARQIERTFDKEKILELYVNHIYLGSGAYGVEAAALTYFGKPASELSLVEAATIAGIPQAPSQINPNASMERATARRDLVLARMADAGFISAAEASEAQAEPITLVEGEASGEGPESSYFVELVRKELVERVGTRFYTAGLQIHTTLDPVAQQSAENELTRQLTAVENGRFGTFRHPTYGGARETGGSDYLQGAVVVMEAATGEVRALVGGRDFDDSKFDRATQALRQPGSAFKPFVYASALERYRSPAHQVEDTPVQLTMSGGQVWAPQNYTGTYDGPMTMREAITRSKNAATVRLSQEVGIGPAIRLARDLGIRTDIPNVPATALGAADVRPIELVAAYGAFANGGDRIEPHVITRVVDTDGRVLWQATPRREQVLDPAVAFVLTTMLQDVVERGTGAAVRAVGFSGAAAGKTGTTNDASDVWFIGYTPDLVAGVWMGMDEPETIVRGASGGTLAAPVWGRMMRTIYADRPAPEGWRAPSGVTTAEVDRTTGAAVNENCPAQGPTYVEYFIRSAPPRQYCPSYEYDRRYTTGDSGWIDEEWSDFEYEYDYDAETTLDSLERPGVDWPELEALRRRIERAREDETRRRTDPTVSEPDDEASDRRPDDLPGRRAPPTSSPAPVITDNEEPSQPPIGDQPARNEGGATGSPSSQDEGPRLLGEPVTR